MQIYTVLKQAKNKLIRSDSFGLDAELLLCKVLDCDRSWLYAHQEQCLSDQDLMQFDHQLLLREQGYPIAQLLGHKEFWSLDLQVSKATLIPRPETELLVEAALQRVPRKKNSTVLDLGTGTGAVAIALAHERSHTTITATDISKEALNVAEKNTLMHGLKNINFSQGNWFDAVDSEQYDVIVSNPPYIKIDDPHLKQGDVRFEPKLALVSGMDGLEDLRRITKSALNYLKTNGWLLLEHGYDQGEAVRQLLEAKGYRQIQTLFDYNRQERVSLGQFAI